MDAGTDGEKFSRNPTLNDIIELCRHLNAANVQYVIIGGFAMIHYGLDRTTSDIDLLVESSTNNIEKIRKALMYLPDQIIQEVSPEDVVQYNVVRVGDEIMIDLMASACGVTFNEVQHQVEFEIIDNVQIPYLKAETLIRTKQSLREKDTFDRMFLERVLRKK